VNFYLNAWIDIMHADSAEPNQGVGSLLGNACQLASHYQRENTHLEPVGVIISCSPEKYPSICETVFAPGCKHCGHLNSGSFNFPALCPLSAIWSHCWDSHCYQAVRSRQLHLVGSAETIGDAGPDLAKAWGTQPAKHHRAQFSLGFEDKELWTKKQPFIFTVC
jgi:hypothetical protein